MADLSFKQFGCFLVLAVILVFAILYPLLMEEQRKNDADCRKLYGESWEALYIRGSSRLCRDSKTNNLKFLY